MKHIDRVPETHRVDRPECPAAVRGDDFKHGSPAEALERLDGWIFLAALGGVFRGLDEQVGFEMGSGLIFLMFAGITLGGLGSAYGALVGGFFVGLFVELASLVVPAELKNAPALLILVVVLIVRPQGILGRKQRVG